jgi:nitrogen fixation/metabolism regulation signal transduction histidine kinase
MTASIMVAVDVSDTGIGMSAGNLRKLFTVFTQADGATTRKFGGSGLGLAISRQLARMMGGDLTVTSEVGRGSTFRLTFKAQAAAAASATAPAAKTIDPANRTLRGLRVLLTDDNAINRQVIKLFLAQSGLRDFRSDQRQGSARQDSPRAISTSSCSTSTCLSWTARKPSAASAPPTDG